MKIRYTHSITHLIVPISAAISAFFMPDVLMIVLFLISVVLTVLLFTRANIVFEKHHLIVNHGLLDRRFKYGDIEKVEEKKHISMWLRGKKGKWELRMKEADKAAFMAELRKRNPRVIVKK